MFVDTQSRFRDYASAQKAYYDANFVPNSSYDQLKKAYDELSKTAAGWESRLERHQMIDGEAEDLFVPRSDLEACMAQLALVKTEKDSMESTYLHRLSDAREEANAMRLMIEQQHDKEATSGQTPDSRAVDEVDGQNDGTRSQSLQTRRSRRVKP